MNISCGVYFCYVRYGVTFNLGSATVCSPDKSSSSLRDIQDASESLFGKIFVLFYPGSVFIKILILRIFLDLLFLEKF